MSVWLFSSVNVFADELLIGTATADITPSLPVALAGQFHLRIANTIETPLTASVIALESRNGNRSMDAAIMVSCDLIGIPTVTLKMIRNEVHKQIPELDVSKIFLNATHPHTGPVLENDLEFTFKYQIPKEGVLQVDEYNAFFVRQIADAITKAWKTRVPGSVSWGMSHAAIAYQRRTVYADGTAVMYGKTDTPEFRNIEGIADHDVNALLFWNQTGKLIVLTINIPCTAQEVEGRSAVNADYIHPVREKLKQRFGSDLVVLVWIGSAGDQSPRNLTNGYKAGEPNLWDKPGIIEIGNRLIKTFDDIYPEERKSIRTKPVFKHIVEDISLPVRIYTEEEYEQACKLVEEIRSREPSDQDSPSTAWNRFMKETHDNEKIRKFGPWDDKKSDYGILRAQEGVIERYKIQEKEPVYNTEIHIIRIDDVALASNPFELFVDYGLRITGRSEARQVFIIQLSGDSGGYLPTREAVKGGGYSAIVNRVGPEGGDIFVDKTISIINSLWSE